MKVKVSNIVSKCPDYIVLCTTEFGEIVLTWKDNIPEMGKEYDVEFDTDDILKWEDDISLTEAKEPSIYMENEEIVVSGTLESVDEDGFMVLRMKDYILTFETKGKALADGTTIRIKIQSLDAYPF